MTHDLREDPHHELRPAGAHDGHLDRHLDQRHERALPYLARVEHRWVAVRGARLHVAELGHGTPVVFLHGFPQHWYAWRKVAPLLAADHRLICVDLRGFGWSTQTRRGYDTEGLGDDVLALLDALELPRAALVGHDWGAQLGFRLCLRAPERFIAFLALNMVHPWPLHRRLLPNLWRMWFTAFVEYPVVGRWVLRHWPAFTRFLLRRGVVDRSALSDADIDEFTAATQVSAHAGQAMFWQYVLRDIPAMLRGDRRRQRLTVRTLVLAGADDPVIPPSLMDGGGRHADELTIRVVPRVGHYLHEERPALVAEAVREILS